jgi:hypothetical protein
VSASRSERLVWRAQRASATSSRRSACTVTRASTAWRDERGNVESSLTLIPLLFLFLIGVQLILAINVRDADSMKASDGASKRAISGNFRDSDRETLLNSPDRFSNISLLISRESRKIPELVPGLSRLLGRDLETDVRGVAIIENTR